MKNSDFMSNKRKSLKAHKGDKFAYVDCNTIKDVFNLEDLKTLYAKIIERDENMNVCNYETWMHNGRYGRTTDNVYAPLSSLNHERWNKIRNTVKRIIKKHTTK